MRLQAKLSIRLCFLFPDVIYMYTFQLKSGALVDRTNTSLESWLGLRWPREQKAP